MLGCTATGCYPREQGALEDGATVAQRQLSDCRMALASAEANWHAAQAAAEAMTKERKQLMGQLAQEINKSTLFEQVSWLGVWKGNSCCQGSVHRFQVPVLRAQLQVQHQGCSSSCCSVLGMHCSCTQDASYISLLGPCIGSVADQCFAAALHDPMLTHACRSFSWCISRKSAAAELRKHG